MLTAQKSSKSAEKVRQEWWRFAAFLHTLTDHVCFFAASPHRFLMSYDHSVHHHAQLTKPFENVVLVKIEVEE
jgi:hypothetical protein